MKLFEEIPQLEGERIILRAIVDEDAAALEQLASNEHVYRTLPTFLYELKYEDKHEVISRMEEECFCTCEGIFLAICFTATPELMMGIAEIYNYEPLKNKASVGVRLDEPYWGRGIATEVIGLLRDYMFDKTDVTKITAHILVDNIASSKAFEKSGFICKWQNLSEDWGRPEQVLVNKYICKASE